MILDIAEKKRKLFDLISAIHKLTAIPPRKKNDDMPKVEHERLNGGQCKIVDLAELGKTCSFPK